MGSSQVRNRSHHVSCIGRQILYPRATREAWQFCFTLHNSCLPVLFLASCASMDFQYWLLCNFLHHIFLILLLFLKKCASLVELLAVTAHSFSVLWRVSVSGNPLLGNLLALTYHLSNPGGFCFVLSYGTLSNDWVIFPQLKILPSYFFLSHSWKIIFLLFYVLHVSLFCSFFSALI